MIVFAAMVAMGVKFAFPLAPRVKIEVTSPVLFASILLLPTPLAMLVGFIGKGTGSLFLRLRWYNVLFNMAEVVLGVGLASMVYSQFLAPGSILNAQVFLPASLAALALYLENTVVVALVSSIQQGKNFFALWQKGRLEDFLPEVAQYILGYTMALLVYVEPAAVVLMVVPGIVVYFALRDRVEKIRLSEELRRQMEELKRTQAQLVQAAKMASLGTLAAGVAHEINNPVFIIGGNAELLLEQPHTHLKTEKARQILTRISEMADRIARIVDNLLSFSRNHEDLSALDLRDVIDRSLELVGKSLEISGVVLAREYCPEDPRTCGKMGQLQQVVLNLITNAKDAMPNGGNLTIRTAVMDSWVKASFTDTGEGISMENMEHLFEPFFTTKGPKKGTGLGLYISRRIMENHEGRIEVESQKGKGSTFTLYLPLLKEPQKIKELAGRVV
ncbi:MAG: hypothetical protein HYX82_02420 [Chloroflexi bacterium]|nr:hypothetical protein [Chloroflexota bacterium]